MELFWEWGVRNPCAVLGSLAAFAGFMGIVDWGIVFGVVTVCFILARLGSRFMRRAEEGERIALLRERAAAEQARFVPEETHTRAAA